MELIDFYIVAPSIVKLSEKFRLRFKLLTTPYKVGQKCYTGRPPKLESMHNFSPRGIHYVDNVLKGWIKRYL